MSKKKNTDMPKESEPKKTPKFKTFQLHGTKYRTLIPERIENRPSWEKADPKKIFSFIPGTIIKLNIKEGDELKEGDNMLILEAMKMRNEINCPFDGTIKSIHIKEGSRIPKGELMIEFE
jgi:biotin carboxyl carrier protein